MLTRLAIKNFKAHRATDLALKNLTLLSGGNGVGKSSVLQALLLLRQSHESKALDNRLQLNKPHCEIGTVKDAFCQFAEGNTLSFALETDGQAQHEWRFSLEKDDRTRDHIPLAQGQATPPERNAFTVFGEGFHYLSAWRMTKTDSDQIAVESGKQFSKEKGQAELVAQFLFYWGLEEQLGVFSDKLHHPSIPHDSGLLAQTTAWEREICAGVNVVPVKTGPNSYAIKYSFNVEGAVTNEYASDNVGFGLTYALPIIVAILSAQKDSLLLIENPEAHLHPWGQSKLAELIALAAQEGVQIILETHSDHILNGILVQCKRFEKEGRGIDRNSVAIYHFMREPDGRNVKAHPVNIREDGKIDSQPYGFFDQTENDLSYLLGF